MVRNSVNANTDYFTFRQINNSEYAITGLSDDGKTQKILSVPGEYNGIKVTTIDAGAFANNATLEKIMISPNTLTVGTLAFYNCSHLSYVYVPTNNTRFLDYSLDTHTTTELKIEAPDDYDLKTMFGIDGNQREASFTYTKSTRPGLIYGTDMPASGLPYIRYFHNMYIYDSIQDITAFTEKESHVNHKITINDSLPYYLLNL
jgi:hypothetical protein